MCVFDFSYVFKVYISSRTAKDCDATAAELNVMGPGSCIPLAANLQQLSEVERLVQEISSREQVLHVLVNNAGAAWGDGIDEHPVCADHHYSSVPGSRCIGRSVYEGPYFELATSVHAYPEMPTSAPCGCEGGWT